MLQFLMTDMEMIASIQNATRNIDGYLMVCMPKERLVDDSKTPPLVLTFDPNTNTVTHGNQSARLSPIQFEFMKYVHTKTKVGYEELQDAVWKRTVSDNAIRAAVSSVNRKLMDSGMSLELVAFHSKVSIERTS